MPSTPLDPTGSLNHLPTAPSASLAPDSAAPRACSWTGPLLPTWKCPFHCTWPPLGQTPHLSRGTPHSQSGTVQGKALLAGCMDATTPFLTLWVEAERGTPLTWEEVGSWGS